jgi:DinB family protein
VRYWRERHRNSASGAAISANGTAPAASGKADEAQRPTYGSRTLGMAERGTTSDARPTAQSPETYRRLKAPWRTRRRSPMLNHALMTPAGNGPTPERRAYRHVLSSSTSTRLNDPRAHSYQYPRGSRQFTIAPARAHPPARRTIMRQRFIRPLAITFAVIASRGSLVAQQVPNHEAAVEVRKQFLADLDTLQHKFVALAEAIPADKYSWRPGSGVRSVGEVFQHVSSEFYVYVPMAYGAAPSRVVGSGDDALKAFEAKSTKADVLKHLREGFAYAKQVVGALDPASIAGGKRLFGGEHTIVETSFGIAGDLHEHLGQLIAYARMNRVTPPWSK